MKACNSEIYLQNKTILVFWEIFSSQGPKFPQGTGIFYFNFKMKFRGSYFEVFRFFSMNTSYNLRKDLILPLCTKCAALWVVSSFVLVMPLCNTVGNKYFQDYVVVLSREKEGTWIISSVWWICLVLPSLALSSVLQVVPGSTELQRHSYGRLCVTPVSSLLIFLCFRKITHQLLMVWVWLPAPSVTSNLSVLVISCDLCMHPFIYYSLQQRESSSSEHSIFLLHPVGTSYIYLQGLVTHVFHVQQDDISGCKSIYHLHMHREREEKGWKKEDKESDWHWKQLHSSVKLWHIIFRQMCPINLDREYVSSIFHHWYSQSDPLCRYPIASDVFESFWQWCDALFSVGFLYKFLNKSCKNFANKFTILFFLLQNHISDRELICFIQNASR